MKPCDFTNYACPLLALRGHALLQCMSPLLTQSGHSWLFRSTSFCRYDTLSEAGAAMRRREFLGGVGGLVLTWPHAAWAQQPGRMPLVAVELAIA